MRDIMAGMDEKDSLAVPPCRGAEAVSHGLDCSADHSSSLVAWTRWLMPLFAGVQVVDIPVVTQRLIHMVQFILQFIDKVVDVPECRFSSSSGAVCEKGVEIPQLQHVEAWTLGGSCAQAQGQGLTPPLRQGRGGGVAGSVTPR